MIVFQNVTKTYGDDVSALDQVSFSIDKGNFVFLVGSTGSGKTTIFRLLIRDLLPTQGNIVLGEWDLIKLPKGKITDLRRRVGYIFQDLKLLMDRTVIENVMLPLNFSGVNNDEARKRATEALMDVGLSDKQDKFPLQLSGGERQRVAVARALVFNPEVILADEPTGNLDLQTSFQILDLLESINKKGTTIFMATHNDKIIEKTKNRVIFLEKGKIIQDKKTTASEGKASSHPIIAGFQKSSEEKKGKDKDIKHGEKVKEPEKESVTKNSDSKKNHAS